MARAGARRAATRVRNIVASTRPPRDLASTEISMQAAVTLALSPAALALHSVPQFAPRLRISVRMCVSDEPTALDADRLERARLRHADTERTLSPPRSPSEETEIRFRQAAVGATDARGLPTTKGSDSDDLNWEPMAPPARRFETGDIGFAVVFGSLALYAVIGFVLYAGGAASALLLLKEAWHSLT